MVLAASAVRAAPVYYTFEGTISVVNDGAGIVSDLGLSVGSELSYTIMVDTDRIGTYTLNNGVVKDFLHPWGIQSYYAELVSGVILPQVNGGVWNSPTVTASSNYGFDHWFQHIYLGSPDSGLYFASFKSSVWELGLNGRISSTGYDAQGRYSQIDLSEVILTNISLSSTPVPEPSTALLLATGLAGLAAIGRRNYSSCSPRCGYSGRSRTTR